jgi:hypothetical protein
LLLLITIAPLAIASHNAPHVISGQQPRYAPHVISGPQSHIDVHIDEYHGCTFMSIFNMMLDCQIYQQHIEEKTM